jgi:hypothetical protein
VIGLTYGVVLAAVAAGTSPSPPPAPQREAQLDLDGDGRSAGTWKLVRFRIVDKSLT